MGEKDMDRIATRVRSLALDDTTADDRAKSRKITTQSKAQSLMRRELTGRASYNSHERVPDDSPPAHVQKKQRRGASSNTASPLNNGSRSHCANGDASHRETRNVADIKTERRITGVKVLIDFAIKPVAFHTHDDLRVGGYRYGEPIGWVLQKNAGINREQMRIKACYTIPEVVSFDARNRKMTADQCYNRHTRDNADYLKQIRDGLLHINAKTDNLGFSAQDGCGGRINLSYKPDLDNSELAQVVRAFVYFERPLKSLYFPKSRFDDSPVTWKGEAPVVEPPDYGLCSKADADTLLDHQLTPDEIVRAWVGNPSRRGEFFGYQTMDCATLPHLYFRRPGAHRNGDDIIDWIKLVVTFVEAALSFTGGPGALRRYPANVVGLGEFLNKRVTTVVSSRIEKSQDPQGHPIQTRIQVEMQAAAFPSVPRRGPPGGGNTIEDNDYSIQRMYDRAWR